MNQQSNPSTTRPPRDVRRSNDAGVIRRRAEATRAHTSITLAVLNWVVELHVTATPTDK